MTMEHIDELVDDLIAREGDYVNHPADRGDPTRRAITEAVARRHGYHDKMSQLPQTEAAAIYKRIYACPWLRRCRSDCAKFGGGIVRYRRQHGHRDGHRLSTTRVERIEPEWARL